MDFKTIVFYILAAILVFAAVRVVTARNPVHSALYLVLAFFTAGGTWLLIQAEFLAITLVLVYVGAVMVLFLFVVMMLDINIERLRQGFWSYLPLGLTVGGLMLAEMIMVVGGKYFRLFEPMGVVEGSNTKAIGRVMYTDYLLPFELSAVVLLVAMVAAIALTHRGRRTKRGMDPHDQITVRRADRVRMVSMPSEKND